MTDRWFVQLPSKFLLFLKGLNFILKNVTYLHVFPPSAADEMISLRHISSVSEVRLAHSCRLTNRPLTQTDTHWLSATFFVCRFLVITVAHGSQAEHYQAPGREIGVAPKDAANTRPNSPGSGVCVFCRYVFLACVSVDEAGGGVYAYSCLH